MKKSLILVLVLMLLVGTISAYAGQAGCHSCGDGTISSSSTSEVVFQKGFRAHSGCSSTNYHYHGSILVTTRTLCSNGCFDEVSTSYESF